MAKAKSLLTSATNGYAIDVSFFGPDQKASLKAIDDKIASIRKRGKQLKIDTHYVLLAIIDHYVAHGDYTRIDSLHSAVRDCVGQSVGQALTTYVNAVVPSLNWDDKEKKFVHTKGAKREMLAKVEWKYNGGKSSFSGNPREFPYFELEVKKSQAPTTLEAKVKAFAKSIATGIGNENITYDEAKDKAVISLLEQMLRDMEGGDDLVKVLEAATNPQKVETETV